MKNIVTFGVIGLVALGLWKKFWSRPADKRIAENFKEVDEGIKEGYTANLINNIRQMPIAFLGSLPLQGFSVNPLDKNNPTANSIGPIQVLPRQTNTSMFSTVVPAESPDTFYKSNESTDKYFLRN